MMTKELHHIVNNPYYFWQTPNSTQLSSTHASEDNFTSVTFVNLTSSSTVNNPTTAKVTVPIANMSSGAGEKGTFKPIDEAQSQKLPG